MYGLAFGQNELLIALATVAGLSFVAYISYRILKNPFCYPYFQEEFDVSRKRNVDVCECIDGFLCNAENWLSLNHHFGCIKAWKKKQEIFLESCKLKKYRWKQYLSVLDDERAFRFVTTRNQTRYRQRNYVRKAYMVTVADGLLAVDWAWLEDRHKRLSEIGFETTLKKYHSKEQRRLMTKTLRKQIMERDNYTCQICGKHMPDEVGFQVDHIVPINEGGKSVPSNLQILCSKCKGSKGKKIDIPQVE